MERAGLFVRIPTAQATQLDRAASRAGMRKQDFVSSLIAAQLDATPQVAVGAIGAVVAPSPRTTAAAATTEHGEAPDDAVLTLDEAASLLRVTPDVLLTRASAGDLPGRRFAEEWRFSRRALFDWLQGSDRVERGGRSPGFRKATS